MNETTQQPDEMGKTFLDLVNQGETHWKKYGLMILIIVAVWTLGTGTVMIGVYGPEPEGIPMDGTNPDLDFIAHNLLFVTVLIGILIGMRRAHRRAFRTLITAHNHIRWRRIFQGFALQMVLTTAFTIIDYLLVDAYTYSLDAEHFYKFAIIALILTPFQVLTKEVFVHGYLLQAFGHVTRHPGTLITLNALPFVLLHLQDAEATSHYLTLILLYFVIGAILTLITLKDNGTELAIGIHTANNLFISIFVDYKDAALPTSTMFATESANMCFGLVAVIYCFLFHTSSPPSTPLDTKTTGKNL